MRIAFLLCLGILAFSEDIKVQHVVSNQDRVLVPVGQGAYQLLAPGVGDVRSITTYYNQHTDTKVVIVERIVQVQMPIQQPVYGYGQVPQQNPIIVPRDNDCGTTTYTYQGGNPFNKNSWKKSGE